MKLNLNYNKPEEALAVESNQETTAAIVTYAVNSVHKEGLEGQLRRVWGRIQRKIDEALDTKADAIELESAEKDFVVRVFENAKFPPQWARVTLVVEEEIDALKK